MKRLVVFIVLYASVLVFTFNTFAGSFSTSHKEVIVKNLVMGLKSNNIGLRSGAATVLSKFIDEQILHKSELKDAIIPLMKMLREGKSDEEKIAAAISLFKIEDMRGIYLLKGAAKYSGSEEVRSIAKDLYIRFHQANKISYSAEI